MDGYLDALCRPAVPALFRRAADRASAAARKIYFKREELNHTGAHKINNVLGQILLARRMGKKRIIAETGAGQHGVATATLCARFGLECIVYMGAVDVERQKPNVFRMKMLGAEVVPVESGSKTLKDAMNEALRDWVTNVARHLLLHRHRRRPASLSGDGARFPVVIGRETREQMLEAEGRLPDSLDRLHRRRLQRHGPVPSRSSTTREIEIFGVEAAGHGLDTGMHAASIAGGRPGVLHGNRTYLLMNDDGQINEAHSISAGLDYPGIGPEHAWLQRRRPRDLSVGDRRRGARRLPALLASSKASSRRSSPRTPSPRCSSSRRRSRRII